MVAAPSRSRSPPSRPQRISINKLPALDFGPAATRSSMVSHGENRPMHHGYRRNSTDLAGGNVTNGGPVLVSVSPIKSERPSAHTRSADRWTLTHLN